MGYYRKVIIEDHQTFTIKMDNPFTSDQPIALNLRPDVLYLDLTHQGMVKGIINFKGLHDRENFTPFQQAIADIQHAKMLIAKQAVRIHFLNRQWWFNLETEEYAPDERDVYGLMNLFHEETGELLRALRKDLMSEKLPGVHGEGEELADLIIRVFDYIGGKQLWRLCPADDTIESWNDLPFMYLGVLDPAFLTGNKQYKINRINQTISTLSDYVEQNDQQCLKLAQSLLTLAFGYADAYDIQILDIIEQKIKYNTTRKDHTLEDRKSKHGKRF